MQIPTLALAVMALLLASCALGQDAPSGSLEDDVPILGSAVDLPFPGLINTLGGVTEGLSNTLGGVTGGLSNTLGGVPGGIRNQLGGVTGPIRNTLAGVTGGLTGGF